MAIKQIFEYYTASGEKRTATLVKAEMDPNLNKPVYVGISPHGHEVRLTAEEIHDFSLAKEIDPTEWSIDCAHCGHQHKEWHEYLDPGDMEGDFDMECENEDCKKPFHVSFKTSITFETSKTFEQPSES